MSEIEEIKLKPCPFCGGEAFVWRLSYRYKISCKQDCVTMPPRFDMWFSSEEEAIKKWNNQILFSELEGKDKEIERMKEENTQLKQRIIEFVFSK